VVLYQSLFLFTGASRLRFACVDHAFGQDPTRRVYTNRVLERTSKRNPLIPLLRLLAAGLSGLLTRSISRPPAKINHQAVAGSFQQEHAENRARPGLAPQRIKGVPFPNHPIFEIVSRLFCSWFNSRRLLKRLQILCAESRHTDQRAITVADNGEKITACLATVLSLGVCVRARFFLIFY